MAIYNGIYSWDGTKSDTQGPIAWFGGSYKVQIVRLSARDNVELLKPYICVFSGTGIGQSISANPEKFAKRICYDFSLELERVLWVEDVGGQGDAPRYEIVVFHKTAVMGETIFYRFTKRPASSAEIAMIDRELDRLE